MDHLTPFQRLKAKHIMLQGQLEVNRAAVIAEAWSMIRERVKCSCGGKDDDLHSKSCQLRQNVEELLIGV